MLANVLQDELLAKASWHWDWPRFKKTPGLFLQQYLPNGPIERHMSILSCTLKRQVRMTLRQLVNISQQRVAFLSIYLAHLSTRMYY